jgi:L,D-transpeptidase ErfK/SrfK
MHGTNKPAGVGMRASHGCIRLYPEDIATLFDRIAVGTPVTVVNQPLVFRWQGEALYVQSYPPHEEHPEAAKAAKGTRFSKALADRMWQLVKPHAATVDQKLAEQVVNEARGVAVPVSRGGVTYATFVAGGRLVENRIPAGANWDGTDNPVPVARAQSANDPGGR